MAIAKLSTFKTGLGTTAETRNGASKTMSEVGDKNRIEEQFISSQVFHRSPGGRVREITAGEQFKPRILESFDPMTQEFYRQLPTMIHTEIHTQTARTRKESTDPQLPDQPARTKLNLAGQ
jgi:hypothetical protein